jgi:hypothetical protein
MKNQNLYLIGLICTTTLAAPVSVVGQPSKTDNTWLDEQPLANWNQGCASSKRGLVEGEQCKMF